MHHPLHSSVNSFVHDDQSKINKIKRGKNNYAANFSLSLFWMVKWIQTFDPFAFHYNTIQQFAKACKVTPRKTGAQSFAVNSVNNWEMQRFMKAKRLNEKAGDLSSGTVSGKIL